MTVLDIGMDSAASEADRLDSGNGCFVSGNCQDRCCN